MKPSSTDVTQVSVRERIRWSDCDPAGIMYFGTYVRLHEIAETEMMRACGFPYSAEGMDALDAWVLRVNFSIDFVAPVSLDDEVVIDIWIGEVGGASFRQEFEVRVVASGDVTARGRCTTVTVDRTTRKARRIPDALRTALMRLVRS